VPQEKLLHPGSAFGTQKPLQAWVSHVFSFTSIIAKEKTREARELQITLTLFATTEPTLANEVSGFAHAPVFR